MRPSETVALSWADLNAERRTVRINKGRSLNEDGEPKTRGSHRTIIISRALMDLIQDLRHPWSRETDKVFLNKHGKPLVPAHFKFDHWDRMLAALKIRPRKFYATRHTFITEMVNHGKDKHGEPLRLKEIADYCGTSVAMIEKHYCAKSQLDPDS